MFGIPAKDLNIAQSAFIAGLPNSPSMFTPFTQEGKLKENLTPGIERMKLVLKRMYEHGYITKKEYDEALVYDIKKDFSLSTQTANLAYPYIMDEVEKRSIEILVPILAKKDGYKDADLIKSKNLRESYASQAKIALADGGYKIYTTIDKNIYDAMEVATKNFKFYENPIKVIKMNPDTKKEEPIMEPVEAGAIMIENATGKILSFVGGRDFFTNQNNHASRTKRQNGSTMKPLLVYGPAVEYGVGYPGKPLLNAPLAIQDKGSGKIYSPSNYSGEGDYSGLASSRYALAKSNNIPAVLQYMEILDRRPATFLEKMGFTSLIKVDYEAPSAALGTITNGVSVEENVNAYATFANNGQFIDAYMIDKIVDGNGKAIFEHKTKKTDVFSPQTAFIMLDMLRSVVNAGTASSVKGQLSFSTDWVGKTGTGSGFTDAWFVASNPSVTFGTWMGYDVSEILPDDARGVFNLAKGARGTGKAYNQINLSLWASLINASYTANANAFNTVGAFINPGGVVNAEYDKVTGGAPTDASRAAGIVGSDLFNAKFLPKAGESSSSGEYVLIDGKKYVANSKTPKDLTEVGVILSQEYLSRLGYQYIKNPADLYVSGSLFNHVIVSDGAITENGKAPDKVAAVIDGTRITWGRVNEPDIIGYYIYKMNGAVFEKVVAIKASQPLEFNLAGKEPGQYYVLAVDIDGKMSDPSTPMTFGPVQTIPVSGENGGNNGNGNGKGNGN